MRQIWIFFSLLVVLSAAILWFTLLSGWISLAPSYAFEIVVLLALTTLVIYYYLFQWSKTKPQLFAQFYLLSIAIKIAAYGVFVAIIVVLDPKMAISNAILFLISYLLFTVLEVLFLFRQVNRS